MTTHTLLVTSITGESGMLSSIRAEDGVGAIVAQVALAAPPHAVHIHPRLALAYVACWGDPAEVVPVSFLPDGAISPSAPGQSRSAGGAQPCSMVIDPLEGLLLVANYDGGITALTLQADGGISPIDSTTLHLPQPIARSTRQDASHPHWVGFTPAGDRLVAADLGADRIYELLASATGPTIALGSLSGSSRAGSGPRHVAFLPGERLLVSDELASSVSLFRPASDGYRLVESVPSSNGTATGNFPSDIAVGLDARFAFVANRGNNTIGVVDAGGNGISLVGEYPVGRWPLSLQVVDDVLYCVSRDEGELSSWRIGSAGRLEELSRMSLPTPTWVASR